MKKILKRVTATIMSLTFLIYPAAQVRAEEDILTAEQDILYYTGTIDNVSNVTVVTQPVILCDDLSYINSLRAYKGLRPLIFSQELYRAAMTRAQEQTVKFSHTRPNGLPWCTVSNKQCGEILARDADSIERAVILWNNSPSHASLLWDRYYRTAAVARVGNYYAMEFGY